MEKIDINYLNSKLLSDLSHSYISGKQLLGSMRMINESSRKTAAYMDHKYAPFYYYLSKYIKPEVILEVGFDLGLLSSSFFYANKFAKKFIGFKEADDNYQSVRLGKANIKSNFKGDKHFFNCNLYDNDFESFIKTIKVDLIFINEDKNFDKILEYLYFFWDNLSENGLIVVEYMNNKSTKDCFTSFCESKNRETIIMPTRYGVGIVQK